MCLHLHTLRPAHTPGRRAAASTSGPISLLYVAVGWKKSPELGRSPSIKGPVGVKGRNIWVCWGHNILRHFISFSLKSLYSQPRILRCTNPRDATGLPKPHHSLPACIPLRKGEIKVVVLLFFSFSFLRMFDLT